MLMRLVKATIEVRNIFTQAMNKLFFFVHTLSDLTVDFSLMHMP